MSIEPTRRVAVIGPGTIGVGWITLLLVHGHDVRVLARAADAEARFRPIVELHARALGREPLGRLTTTTDLAEAVADAEVVIECVAERLDVKQDLFARVAAAAPADALLLSSTSTLLPDALGAKLDQPGRVIVAHPFNPPHVIPLVEVLGGAETGEAALADAKAFLAGLGRTPVQLRRPIAGFVANRLQTALLRECIHLVQQGVVTVGELDEVVTGSIGLRWSTIGPFHALHLGGGPGGLRQWFGHIGVGLAAGWGQLGAPELDQSTIDDLIEQAEQAFGTTGYEDRVAARDAGQLAVLDALTKQGADRG